MREKLEAAGSGPYHPEHGFGRIQVLFPNAVNESLGDGIQRQTLPGIILEALPDSVI